MPGNDRIKNLLRTLGIIDALSEIGVYITDYTTGETLSSSTWKEEPVQFQVDDISDDFLNRIHPEDRERIRRDLEAVHNGDSSEFNTIYRMKNGGSWKWIKSKGRTVLTRDDGKPILFVGSDTDITELKITEEKLQKSIQKEKERSEELEMLRRMAADFTTSLDTRETCSRILVGIRRIIPYDSASVQLLEDSVLRIIGVAGFSNPDEVSKLTFSLAAPGSLSSKALQDRKPVLSGDVSRDFPAFIQPLDFTIRSWIGIPLISRGEPIGMLTLDHRETDQFNPHHLELAEIIGDHIASALDNSLLHEQAYRMAMEDALTGIGSRHRLQIEGRILFETAIRKNTEISLALLDIDHFKQVNDRYGHDTGDLVLKRIAKTCSGLVRTTDLLARLGGEEFIIVLPETGSETAQQIIQRIRQQIEMIVHPEIGDPVTVSAGVYSGCPDKDHSLGAFQIQADKALYLSKANGRNRVTMLPG